MEPSRKVIPLTLVAQPAPVTPPRDFQGLLAWVGARVQRLEELEDDRTREEVFALLEGVDLLHRHALGRLLELVGSLGGQGLVERVAQDSAVRSLLDMYDLPEPDEATQVERVLAGVYPYMQSHGGRLDVLGVERGRVRVRLSGSCGSCPASSLTLKRVVEEALRDGFPGFSELVAEEVAPAVKPPLPVSSGPPRRPRWVTVTSLAQLSSGEMRGMWPESKSVLLVRVGADVYAYGNACPPGSPLVLHTGQLEGTTLICPWHGCRYDVLTGKRQDAEGKLEVLPVAVQDGEIKVALGVEEVVE